MIKICMAKKFYKTECVYCLRYFEELTSDHIFPQAWYLDAPQKGLSKLQVPACYDCNQKWSKTEDKLFAYLGLCVDPTDPIYSDVAGKAVRSAKRSCAKNKRNGTIRKKRLQKIMGDVIPSENIPKQSIVPGFGFQTSFEPNEQMGVKVPSEQFNAFGEKLIRGISYICRHKTYIDHDHDIHIYIPQRDGHNYVHSIQQHWQEYNFSPTLSVRLAFTVDDDQSGLF